MLFADFRKKKLRNTPSIQTEPSVVANPSTEPSPEEPLPNETLNVASSDDDELTGIEIKAYARKNAISTEKVWDMIRTGRLVARTENGFVYVYGSSVPNDIASRLHAPVVTESDSDIGSLPPLPDKEEKHALAVVPPASAEVALLMDHLALAKEQNLEILRMTQQSIDQMRSMTEQVIQAKNETLIQKTEIINHKDAIILSQNEEISLLRKQLAEEKVHKRHLKQELEDMEMLTKTLGI